LRIFSVLPRPVSPLVNPPGGIPLHRIERRHKPGKRWTHTNIHPRTKAPETPHNAPTTQAGHNDTNNRTTHAAGHDERRTQCTHTHERHKPGTRSQAFKACHAYPGGYSWLYFTFTGRRYTHEKAPVICRGCKIIYSFSV